MCDGEKHPKQVITECGGIEATEDAQGRIIMLGFCRKGVALLLTYAEALALGRVLRRMEQAKDQSKGGANGNRT